VSTRATDLNVASIAEISETLRHLLADLFALFSKTNSFHWHISGREVTHQTIDDEDPLPDGAFSAGLLSC